jgi:3-phenylpropionate/trans-cinnamate dioxygenase ferredoxin component
MSEWIRVAPLDEINDEDVARFDHGQKSYAIYRLGNQVYASDGLCTHERAHLADGFLFDYEIECPKHNGRFDIRDGRAVRVPACIDVRIYPTKVEGGDVYIEI